MQNDNLCRDGVQETTDVERRNFLKRSMLGGIATAFFSASSAYGMADGGIPAGECKSVAAADLLLMFSSLAWKLPNELRAATEARNVENKIYKDFNTLYQELVNLSKQLKIKCDAVSQKDPRLQDIFELADAGQNNVRYIQTASFEEKDVAYLQLATLAVAARQVARSANEILPEKLVADDPDNKIICQMLGKINEIEKIKSNLDAARTNFQNIFKGFVDSLGSLNKLILDASESAAKADRGGSGTKDAIVALEAAEAILNDLSKKSLAAQTGMITPEELKLLLNIPKKILKKEIPEMKVSERRPGNSVEFQTVGFTSSERAADAVSSMIERIVVENLRPASYWFTVVPSIIGCMYVLKSHDEIPVRRRLINNVLQCTAAASNSNFAQASALIARINF